MPLGSFGLFQRECEGKSAAFSVFRFYLDLAVMPLDEHLGDGKPKACAARRNEFRRFKLPEFPKKLRNVFLLNADPRILDRDSYFVGVDGSRDRDLALEREFDGVFVKNS